MQAVSMNGSNLRSSRMPRRCRGARRRSNHLWVGDARDMDACIAAEPGSPVLADNSVALVVTSPPYFAGKDYEIELGKGEVPSDYRSYLILLRDVFAECLRKLEPGGRIAVNVANLGRKPYRSAGGRSDSDSGGPWFSPARRNRLGQGPRPGRFLYLGQLPEPGPIP